MYSRKVRISYGESHHHSFAKGERCTVGSRKVVGRGEGRNRDGKKDAAGNYRTIESWFDCLALTPPPRGRSW
jgi:hypothetical protein